MENMTKDDISKDSCDADENEVDLPCECEIQIELPTARHAEQLCAILRVDAERGAVVKELSAHNTILQATIRAGTVKLLRTVVSSFYDYLIVALKCYQEFDDDTVLQSEATTT